MKARGVFALQNTMLSNGKRLTMLEQYHPEEWFDIPNRYNTNLKGKPIKLPEDADVSDQTPSITPEKSRDLLSQSMKPPGLGDDETTVPEANMAKKTGKGVGNDNYWWVTMY